MNYWTEFIVWCWMGKGFGISQRTCWQLYASFVRFVIGRDYVEYCFHMQCYVQVITVRFY